MSNSALAAGVRYLRDLVSLQGREEESDEQLLHAFTSRRDDNAFAVLVRRHGPMILHVCRRILGHEQDAEDAFQATFLVLARNAAAVRNQKPLAGFLHGIAYRTALKARQTAARRHKHEGCLGALTQPRSSADPAEELSWREVRTILDEEIARLPEIYRSVFVLCCLEGASRAEAARRLRVKEGTVSSRLTMARQRLAQRLARRGVELTAVLAMTTLASALPARLMARTVEAALAMEAVSASVAELVQETTATMMLSKTKIVAVVLLTAGMLTGAGLWTHRVLETHALALAAFPATQPPAQSQKQPSSLHQAVVKPNEQNNARNQKGDTIDIRGIVVDPDGRPSAGAKIYFLARHRLMQAEPEAGFARVRAITDGEGRFHFRAARIQVQPSEDEEVRFIQNKHGDAVVTAVATDHGLGWAAVRKLDEAGHLTLKLAKDDVPLRGRVVDLEGRPIHGVKARVMLVIPMRTENLQPWLDTLPAQKKNGSSLWRFQGAEIYPEAAGLEKTAVTDAEGRFQLRGIGRERVVKLRFEGPAIETRDVFVRTRPGPTLELSYPSIPPSKEKYAYYGAVFEHAAAPTVPIVGTVRDKDTGKPLAGIILQARVPSAEGGLTAEGGPRADYLRTVSDKDGRYRLIGLPKRPGQIIRAYSGPGQSYVRLGKRIAAGVGLSPVRVDFALKRGVLIRGRVTDKTTGRPVQAEVEYFILSENQEYVEGAGGFREGWSISALTATDGSFSVVGLPRRGIVAAKVWWAKADRYIVAAGAEQIKGANRYGVFLTYPFVCHQASFHSLHEVNPAGDAESVVCNIALDHGKTVTGLVLGPDRRPLTGVRIEGPRGIRQRDPQRLKTPRFTVTAINPKAPQWVFFLQKEKQLGAAIRLTGEEPNDFAVRLQPCATIAGRIVDAEGRPRPGLQLAGSLGLFQTNPTEGGFLGVRTGKDGRFRVTGLIPGLKWRAVHVYEGGMFIGQLLRHVAFQPGEIKKLGDIQVKTFEDDE